MLTPRLRRARVLLRVWPCDVTERESDTPKDVRTVSPLDDERPVAT